MTREEEIKKRLFEISTSNFNNSVVDSSAYFAGYIDGAMWADKHPHWISVEDELPPKEDKFITDISVDVLATDGKTTHKCFYDYNLERWLYGDLWQLDDVTHWMYLPSVEHLKKGIKNE